MVIGPLKTLVYGGPDGGPISLVKGGLPNKMQKDVLERYAKNPQFLIKPAQDTEVMISLTQTGGRLLIDGNYYVYPFSEYLNYAAVSIFKLPTGKKTISIFDPEAQYI